MRAFVLAVACAIGRTAAAADLTIAVEPPVVIAPATVTLTASSAAEVEILSYRWSGLGNAPRCRKEQCAIDLPVASCTAVSLEAIDTLGQSHTATRAVCASDEGGGKAPELALSVGAGVATASISSGSDTLAFIRAWVDGEEDLQNPTELHFDAGPGCHALDAFAVDHRGRIAIAQKTVCGGETSPELWVGANPTPFAPLGDAFELCVDSAHPLGESLTRTGGLDQALIGCGMRRDAPRSIERVFLSVVDEHGVPASASTFIAATPPSGSPVLFFADVNTYIPARHQQSLAFIVLLYGGSAPFQVSGLNGLSIEQERPDSLSLVVDRLALPVGPNAVALVVRDARGLEAKIATTIDVTNSEPDPNHPIVTNDSGTSCRCVRVPRTGALRADEGLALASIFLIRFAARRRAR